MKVAVFCASANDIDPAFFEDARKLGKRIGELGWELVYGGTNMGLMREVACATKINGGKVIGIIPENISQMGVTATDLDCLIVAPDMKERKHLLQEHADAFIALPGGWGTLDEVTEVITLKQLNEHQKPIVFLNTKGFYDQFMGFIRNIREQEFISPAYDHLYQIAEDVEELINLVCPEQKGRV